MSTLEEALATRHRLSVYHVYHEGEEHLCITPFLDLKKEFGYTNKHQSAAEEYERNHRGSDESNSYFVHNPTLAFHSPPRTLRRGSKKLGEPICLIHNSAFWRRWKLQFGRNLGDVVDRRGVVKWEHRSSPNNSTAGDVCALEGYKVRSWRLWGESGKEYHYMVNARRQGEGVRAEEEQLRAVEEGSAGDDNGEKTDIDYPTAEDCPSFSLPEPPFQPAVAEETVSLSWDSPFSVNNRRYHFEYAGIYFFWEGTRDLPGGAKWSRRLLPFHHLKLIAKLPGQGTKDGIFLAQYTSSIASKKCGQLWIFNSAITKLLEQTGNSVLGVRRFDPEEGFEFHETADIRMSRVYEVIMATAMCMILGEWQKRLTVWLIFMLFGSMGEGANIAGASS